MYYVKYQIAFPEQEVITRYAGPFSAHEVQSHAYDIAGFEYVINVSIISEEKFFNKNSEKKIDNLGIT